MEQLTLQQKTVNMKVVCATQHNQNWTMAPLCANQIFFCGFRNANKLIAEIPSISSQHFAVATADIRAEGNLAAKEQTIWQPACKGAPSIYTHTVTGDRCSCGGSNRSGLINYEPPVCKTRGAYQGCLLDRWGMTPVRKTWKHHGERRAEGRANMGTRDSWGHGTCKTQNTHKKKTKQQLYRVESVRWHTLITTPTPYGHMQPRAEEQNACNKRISYVFTLDGTQQQ